MATLPRGSSGPAAAIAAATPPPMLLPQASLESPGSSSALAAKCLPARRGESLSCGSARADVEAVGGGGSSGGSGRHGLASVTAGLLSGVALHRRSHCSIGRSRRSRGSRVPRLATTGDAAVAAAAAAAEAATKATAPTALEAAGAEMARPTRVVIAGAGPAGLCLASVLGRLPGYEVQVVEARPDPRQAGPSGPGRSHSIGLSRRAREALVAAGGEAMWQRIASRGLPADKFMLHFDGMSLGLPPAEDEPALLVDRGEITMALREHLEALQVEPGASARIEYSSPIVAVDLVRRNVTLRRDAENGKEEAISYDILVGCDGVRSLIRRAMLAQLPSWSFESEVRLLPGRWKTLHMEMPEGLGADTVHATVSPSAPFGLFTIPAQAPGPACTIVSWSAEAEPEELLAATTPEEVNAALSKFFPKFGQVPEEAAQRFLEQRPSKAIAARCRPMHNTGGAVALVGDAAHPVGTGSLGQGCNAALQDAAALADCLKSGDTLEEALTAYSQRQAPEGWALLDLLELQAASEARAAAVFQGPVLLGFFLEQLGRGILGPLLRQFQDILYRRRSSSMRRERQVRAFFDEVLFGGRVREYGLPVLGFISEQFALGALARLFGIAARAVDLPLQKALMATTEPYSSIARRNEVWLQLMRESSGKGSAAAAQPGPLGEAFAEQMATLGRLLEAAERSIRDMVSDTADFAQGAAARFSELPWAAASLESARDAAADLHELPWAAASLIGADRDGWLAALGAESRLAGELLVRESAPCDRFFTIRSGRCGVFRGGHRLAELGPGDSFGEVAVFTGAPSPVAVLAESDVALSVVSGEALLRLASRNDVRASLEAVAANYGVTRASVVKEQAEARRRVRPLIAEWLGRDGIDANAKMIDDLLDSASCETYAAGDVVELEPGRLRLVQAGVCSVVAGGVEIRRLTPGEVFLGPERAQQEERVVAMSEVNVCSLDLRELEAHFGLVSELAA
mmetsp:Transcript_51210/g.134461  ORF Transcript_51210/g.134461 Transcript_51210/m.134461 type:complete len:975 (-) Transcript_51210:393-3317(-)